jgi:hypothetical protein
MQMLMVGEKRTHFSDVPRNDQQCRPTPLERNIDTIIVTRTNEFKQRVNPHCTSLDVTILAFSRATNG